MTGNGTLLLWGLSRANANMYVARGGGIQKVFFFLPFIMHWN